MTLEFINRFEDAFADMKGLEANGISLVRRLMQIPEAALKYIQDIEKTDAIQNVLTEQFLQILHKTIGH